MALALKVENLDFSFGDKTILKDVNLEIREGDYVGIIGPNGSGKSTLIKIILGILKQDKGSIKIFGENVGDTIRKGEIGYISQKANAFNGDFPATVYEVIGAGLNKNMNIFQNYDEESRKKIDAAIDIVGLRDCKNKLIGKLSGGQKQRVFIARAVVSNPRILFLDEPMVGVDQVSEDAVYCLLAKLNREMGITIIMVTHDIGAITVHANKFVCMGNGNINIHEEKLTYDDISSMYSYGVSVHMHQHRCKNCFFNKY